MLTQPGSTARPAGPTAQTPTEEEARLAADAAQATSSPAGANGPGGAAGGNEAGEGRGTGQHLRRRGPAAGGLVGGRARLVLARRGPTTRPAGADGPGADGRGAGAVAGAARVYNLAVGGRQLGDGRRGGRGGCETDADCPAGRADSLVTEGGRGGGRWWIGCGLRTGRQAPVARALPKERARRVTGTERVCSPAGERRRPEDRLEGGRA